MKNIKKLVTSFALSLSLLVSCGTTLIPPRNVALNDRTVSWTEIAAATGYRVKVQEDTFDTEVTSFTLPNAYYGSLSISVATKLNDKLSAYSEPIVASAYLHLAPPANLHQDGALVYWDAVEEATGYVVKINGAEFPTTLTQYAISTTESVEVAVLAVGTVDGYVVSSAYSSTLTIKIPLPAPTNIVWADGVLSWDAVALASSYVFTLNEGQEISTPAPRYDIGFDYVGEFLIKVKAISGDDTYEDSSWAEQTVTIPPLTLATPTEISLDGSTLSFTPVDHAESYDIYWNGSYYANVTLNSFTLTSEILALSGSYIQVMAKSSIHNVSALSAKIYIGSADLTTEAQLKAMLVGGNYTLGADIVLTEAWTPKEFQGYLDGNGHTISGITSNGGFFSILDGATISDLVLEGTITVNLSEDGVSVGGLCGIARNSSISEVEVNFDINVVESNGVALVGGAVGTLINSNLTHVNFNGNINSENAITGGLIGKIFDAEAERSVFQCGASGTLIVSGGEQSYAGGFVGLLTDNYLTISESVSRMSVTGTSYVGGFVGYMGTGTIENSLFDGTVMATSTLLVHAGGFIGRLEGYNNKVSYSIAKSTVTTEPTDTNIRAGSFVGVTTGGSYASIYTSCAYDSTVSSLDRIGNPTSGTGSGITGVAALTAANLPQFSSEIWNFSDVSPIQVWEQASL